MPYKKEWNCLNTFKSVVFSNNKTGYMVNRNPIYYEKAPFKSKNDNTL